MGPWDEAGLGTGIAPPPTHPATPTPGTPLPYGYSHDRACGAADQCQWVVGLKSVAQLSLYLHFSGSRGITEVYNLYIAGNPNDQKYIPGTK